MGKVFPRASQLSLQHIAPFPLLFQPTLLTPAITPVPVYSVPPLLHYLLLEFGIFFFSEDKNFKKLQL